MQFTPALRHALRLLDGSSAGLKRVLVPTSPGDLLRGRFDDHAIFHPIPVVQVCLCGPLRIRTRGGVCDLQPGDALAIPAATWYRYPPPHPQQYWVGFGWLGQRADLWLSGPGLDLWAGMPLEPARTLIRQAVASTDAGRRLDHVRALLDGLADETLDHLRSVPLPVERMLDVLLRRLHRAPAVADVVRASGLGRSQAYARFTSFYGLSPHRALEIRRLELAAALLANGHGVAACADACGWRNRETFSRCWSRHHGSPPRAARLTPAAVTGAASPAPVPGTGRSPA